MIRSWKQRVAQLSETPGSVPGEGEKLPVIWQGAALITGRKRLAQAALKKIKDKLTDSKNQYCLEDVADRARELVLETPDFGRHESWQKLDHVGPSEEEGYALLYSILIEPFRFLEMYERKDV